MNSGVRVDDNHQLYARKAPDPLAHEERLEVVSSRSNWVTQRLAWQPNGSRAMSAMSPLIGDKRT